MNRSWRLCASECHDRRAEQPTRHERQRITLSTGSRTRTRTSSPTHRCSRLFACVCRASDIVRFASRFMRAIPRIGRRYSSRATTRTGSGSTRGPTASSRGCAVREARRCWPMRSRGRRCDLESSPHRRRSRYAPWRGIICRIAWRSRSAMTRFASSIPMVLVRERASKRATSSAN